MRMVGIYIHDQQDELSLVSLFRQSIRMLERVDFRAYKN